MGRKKCSPQTLQSTSSKSTRKTSGHHPSGNNLKAPPRRNALSLKYAFLLPLLLVYGATFHSEDLWQVVQYTSAGIFTTVRTLSLGETGSLEEGVSIPDEVKNFKPHWQKSFSVRKTFVDGRHIEPVQLVPGRETNSSVRLYVVDEFLSDSECEGLIRAHKRHILGMEDTPLLCFDSLGTLRSHLKDVGMATAISDGVFSPGTLCLNASFSWEIQTRLGSNWSYSTAFYPKESPFSTTVADRIHNAMGLSPEAGGKFQITSYPVGKAYKTHTDCVLGGSELRDRVVSVIMYLNDVTDGGETKFPELGISVVPRKGRALVWNNMSPEGVCEHDSRHIASVINSGSKYILMRWYYYKSFYSIGKRAPSPSLPVRGADVPMVMCDWYTHGSCRWYDEWTPQVLTHYAHNQHGYY